MTVQLTIDFNAVAYCKYFYENRRGDTRRVIPKYSTVNGSRVPDEKALSRPGHPEETMMELARRRNLFDTWTPVCVLQFRNNHSMRFTGDKAKQMKQSYDKHIYKKS